MAAKQETYPRDEFDVFVGKNDGGAHRGKKTVFARVLPFALAIIIAFALAMGLWMVYHTGAFNQTPGMNGVSQSISKAKEKVSQSKTSQESSSDSSDASDSENSTDTASEDETSSSSSNTSSESSEAASAQVDKSAAIVVFNGNNVAGFAAQKAVVLTNAGFTQVTPMNPTNRSSLPSVATVWYVDDADQATAQEVAKALGITNVTKVTALTAGKIAVIAR